MDDRGNDDDDDDKKASFVMMIEQPEQKPIRRAWMIPTTVVYGFILLHPA